MQKVISIILSFCFLCSLIGCGSGSKDATSDSPSPISENTEGSENLSYSQYLSLYQEKAEALLAESPVDTDSLWKIYTALYYVQVEEYLFKGKLNVKFYHEDGSDFPGKDTILASCNALKEQMLQYFPEEQVEDWLTNTIILNTDSLYDRLEVDNYKVTNRKGKIDLEASWEKYFQQNIDLEKLSGVFLNDQCQEVTITFPDGSQLINEGTYKADWGEFTMTRIELSPGSYDFLDFEVNVQDWFRSNSPYSMDFSRNSNQQKLYWKADNYFGDEIEGYIEQSEFYNDSACYVAGYIVLSDGYYDYEIIFQSDSTDNGYTQVINSLNSIHVNGAGLGEAIPACLSVEDAMAEQDMTDIQRHQEILNDDFSQIITTYPFCEDDMTSSFINEDEDVSIVVNSYRNASGEIIHYMDYSYGNIRLDAMPCVYMEGDDRNILICYLEYSFPNLSSSEIWVAHDLTDNTYTFSSYIAGDISARGCMEMHYEFLETDKELNESQIYQNSSGPLQRMEPVG